MSPGCRSPKAPPRARHAHPRLPSVWAGLAALALVAAACGGSETGDAPDAGAADTDAGAAADAAPQVDPTDELFRPDHILEVTITLAPADWEALRHQPDGPGMPKTTCGNQPAEKAYTYFPADITVDGVTVTNVGVRKKGGFGSLSSARPGLKVKATEFVSGQRISGSKRLTLNNNHQDPTLISQCLGYALFRQAGLPASRCSFARVTVNGEDLGIYSNVESIKPAFLGRHFADDTGRLYESGGDFLPGYTDGFQPKTNSDNPDCSDLDGVVTALQADDADFADRLGSVVDMDAFITYWAMEILLDHWDGYANNRNNYFFYHDPTSDKFHFLPWGIDDLFSARERTTRPDSVFACGSLAWRLYDVPGTRDLYLAKLRQLIGTVWDEPAILAEITRMQVLLEPAADPTGSGELAAEIQTVRDFVTTRGAILLGELDTGPPVWPYAAGDESCRIKVGSLTAGFDTKWDSLDDFSAGTGTITGTVSGTALTSSTITSNAGLSAEGGAQLQLFALLSDGRYAVVYVIVQDVANFVPGVLPLDLRTVAAIMTFYDPVTDTSSGGGLMLGGNLTLTSTSQTPDGPVTATITGDVYEL